MPNPGGFLTPGQFGRLQLLGSGEYEALLVPDSAILSDQSLTIRVGPGQRRPPRAARDRRRAISSAACAIVRTGLQRDDRIVITGMQRVRPGARVTPTTGRIETAVRQLREGDHGDSPDSSSTGRFSPS